MKQFYEGYANQALWPLFPMWANKGALAIELLPGVRRDGFILGIGDDRTDEDMFAHLPENAWSVHGGGGPSRATYSVADTGRIRHLLRQLTQSDPETRAGG
jgi:trehalose 6-phosphate synthase/phosphatase